jgi:hypothetical protein
VRLQGEPIVVNAEEDPGAVFAGGDDLPQIDDWSVAVMLADVSHPVACEDT